MVDPQNVITFWFEECDQEQWFKKDVLFDQKVTERFLTVHTAAVRGELLPWRETAEGRLAEIIVLDQFSRNMFRDKPESFAYDPLALALAQEAVQQKCDQKIAQSNRIFFYMPYMHSESKLVHEWSINLFQKLGAEITLDFARKHQRIIDRFNRYPHRNEILGRATTPEEAEFMKGPDSSF